MTDTPTPLSLHLERRHIDRFELLIQQLNDEFENILSLYKKSLQAEYTAFFIDYAWQLNDEINKSIIAGEYIELPNITINLNSLRTRISDFLSLSIQTEGILSEIILEFVKTIDSCVSLYEDFFLKVRNIITLSENEVYINKTYDREKISGQVEFQLKGHTSETEPFKKSELAELYELLIINTHLALLDFTCTPDEKTFYKLQYIENILLYSNLDKDYIPVLREKAAFLKFKVLLRFYQAQKKLGNDLIVIHRAGRNGVLEALESFTNQDYGKFLNYTLNHYEITPDWLQRITLSFKSLRGKPGSEHNNHLKIRYFKDFLKSRNELQNLKNHFQASFQTQTSDFDIFAYSISLNYSINNLFSLTLSQNCTLTVANKLYEEILEVRKMTSLKNFFPELRFLDYLVEKLNHIYKTNAVLASYEEIEAIIQKCNKLIASYRENINWTKNNHSYIYQLPFKECLSQTDPALNLRQIFTCSTFILPLDKAKYMRDFDQFEQEVRLYEKTLQTISNFKRETQKLDELNSEIRGKESKYIEILGIFCSITTFASAAILAFMADRLKGGGNLSNSELGTPLTFLLGTGAIMTIFVFLIVLITRGKSFSRWSVTLLVLTFMLLGAAITQIKKSEAGVALEVLKQKNQRLQDSLKTVKGQWTQDSLQRLRPKTTARKQ